MKKLITLILFISLSFNLYSQKVNVETDSFSDKKIITTSWELLSKDSGVFYRFIQNENGIKFLDLAITCYETTIFNEGSELKVKLDTDTMYNLYSMDYSIATIGGGKDASVWLSKNLSARIQYLISGDINKTLETNKVTDVRLYYNLSSGSAYRNVEVKSKESNKLQKAYKMFIDEINK